MIVSSGGGHRGGCLGGEASVVANQGPDQADEATGERDEGLDVPLSLVTSALVERPRGAVGAFDRRERSEVEHPAQAAVIALRAVRVAAHAAGVTRYRGQSGVGGQPSGVPNAAVRSPPVSASSSAPRTARTRRRW